ncbi:MAG: metal-dependent hydrolase, partial [Planctomycetes bacterium]|nr:metal-dependent hydrolase [Planctomycetota bacterium]
RAAVFLFLATASHGLLDAFTDGGLGIALLAPFSSMRWFAPWRPIAVAPIGVGAFFSEWGLRVMVSELRWVWLPVLAVAGPVAWWRWRP